MGDEREKFLENDDAEQEDTDVEAHQYLKATDEDDSDDVEAHMHARGMHARGQHAKD